MRVSSNPTVLANTTTLMRWSGKYALRVFAPITPPLCHTSG
jgi:hypothetical protein